MNLTGRFFYVISVKQVRKLILHGSPLWIGLETFNDPLLASQRNCKQRRRETPTSIIYLFIFCWGAGGVGGWVEER